MFMSDSKVTVNGTVITLTFFFSFVAVLHYLYVWDKK